MGVGFYLERSGSTHNHDLEVRSWVEGEAVMHFLGLPVAVLASVEDDSAFWETDRNVAGNIRRRSRARAALQVQAESRRAKNRVFWNKYHGKTRWVRCYFGLALSHTTDKIKEFIHLRRMRNTQKSKKNTWLYQGH